MTGPLAGIKIIDMSNTLMGPYTTQILGDMGAEIIKIESLQGDPLRGAGHARHAGMGALFLNVNRSKRSIALDLKRKEARAVISRLIETADAFVYNLRPNAMGRLGLAYADVSAMNPRIVYAGLFGFGQDGPYADKPAYDDLIQAEVALPTLVGVSGGGEPRYVPAAIVDRGVAFAAVGAIVGALFHQLRTGEGQRVDIPMFETMAEFVLGDHLAGHTFEPPLGPMGYARTLSTDRRPFGTRDGFICVMIYTDDQWRKFYELTGRSPADDPRLRDMATRTRNIDALYGELAELLKEKSTAEWIQLFEAGGIPHARMKTLDDLLHDQHLEATKFFSLVDHPSEGLVRTMRFPSQWSVTQPMSSRQAPLFGQHTAEILREHGYNAQAIDALAAAKVTASANSGEPR